MEASPHFAWRSFDLNKWWILLGLLEGAMWGYGFKKGF